MKYHQNPLIKYIQKQINERNQNFQAVIIGDPGTGKSSSSIKLAQQITKNEFNPKEDIVFDGEQFLEGIANHKWKQGDAIVFDEVGETMNTRESMTIINRAINSVARTYRRQNLAIIMNLPSFGTLDKEIRKLLDALIETKHINRQNKYVKCKFLFLQYNNRNDKIYYKRPKIKDKNGIIHKQDYIKIGKPDPNIWKAYENLRDKFQHKINQHNLKRIKTKLGKTTKKNKEPTKKEQIKDELEKNPKADVKTLANKYDVSRQYVYNIRAKQKQS